MKLYQFPLIKSVFWFILGIVLFHFFTFSFFSIIFIWGFLISIGLIFSITFFRKQIGQLGMSILISLIFTISGILISMLHEDTCRSSHFTHYQNWGKKVYIKGIIYERLKSTPNKKRYIVSIQSINQKNNSGKVILNIIKEKQNAIELTIGSVLLMKGVIYPIQTVNNLGQFDYASYLKTKNIYGQLCVKKEDLKSISPPVRSIRYYAALFRDRIINRLQKNGFPEKELAVLTALVIGQQQEVDEHLTRVYQDAGIIHILSVSGLHVGILYLILDFILAVFLRDKRYDLLKLFFVLLGLWGFAFVAGLAASVVRSTVMFSMLAIGVSFKKEINIYNTLAASVFLILIVQPAFLFDIGFQLSYLAVLSIVSMQPIVIGLWSPKNKIVLFFWKLFVVSLVAQIGTLPLSLYYFHQIPGLFFIANLLVIPLLEYIIMPLGVLVVLFAYFNCVVDVFVWILVKIIQLMNFVIKWIASFEEFIWKGIPFTFELMLVSYIISIFLFIWLQKPRFKTIITVCSFLLLFQTILILKKIKDLNEEKLIVFHVPKQRMIAISKRGKTLVYTNNAIGKGRHLEHVLHDYQVQGFNEIFHIDKEQHVFWISGKKVLLVDSNDFVLDKTNVDFLILSNSPKINLERMIRQYRPKMIISDGSNFKSYVKFFKATCLKRKIPFHNTFEKGSCIIE
ncbi:ComEC/Rec2 family competence protein [Flavobacterium davisii]|uniref:ComEC/Rec2 family competence protein n=1 Tax=Flavobacterium davisii TaxID=2906077 RepID=UPI0021646CA0|nr:ComEC/Rec2 family competence protein [Flavobacterium davisii]